MKLFEKTLVDSLKNPRFELKTLVRKILLYLFVSPYTVWSGMHTTRQNIL